MRFEPVSYRLEPVDYIRLNRAAYFRQMRWTLPLIMAVLAFSLRDELFFSGDRRMLWLLPILGVLVALGLLVHPFVLLPRRARTVFRELHALSEEATLTLGEDGFKIEQESGSNRYQWDHMVRWTETPTMVIVHPSRNLLLWFAKEAVGAERLAFMKARLIASGLPNPGKVRK